MPNKASLDKLITETADILGLERYVIEKDIYVTKAISVLSQIKHDIFGLFFQGGTSLAKAYRIIERMSEDCDFRVCIRDRNEKLSRTFLRKHMRLFRGEIISALTKNNFIIPKDNIRVKNEGQYMVIKAIYPSMYPITQGLKPFLALEFFLGSVRLIPETKTVTTLIKRTLCDKIEHDSFPIDCLAVLETAAEKWVGLTRRVATSKHRDHYKDPNLVRHLYDLYKIDQCGYFNDHFPKLVCDIMLSDREQFKNHSDDYYQDPISEIQRALHELENSTEWHHNWDVFNDAMIYADDKPTFEAVMANLKQKSQLALQSLTELTLA